MNGLLAAALLPLYFTSPADRPGADATDRVRGSAHPVHAYAFHRLEPNGTMTAIPGYADSAGTMLLKPHAPGTRETVWVAPAGLGRALTVYVMSRDEHGRLSGNGSFIGARRGASPAMSLTALPVPIVKQEPERCGPAALAMVLRYYGAGDDALRQADAAYDRILRGSLITDLAGAARRAGYEAVIATLTPDSLIDLLKSGVPPILLYQNGRGPITVRHFGVVTGWDAARASFTLHDGGARPRVTPRDDLARRWETAGSQALIVRQRAP